MINRKPKRSRKAEQWVEAPLPEGTYADDTKPFSSQDLVNCLKESAEAQGTRSAFQLLGVPGLLAWASIGNGPFRGARNVESKRFAVMGNYLCQFSTDGTSAEQLGYVPGLGLVQMSHNQIAGGHEVAIATGSAGYIYNTVTEVFAKITDPSFSGGRSVTFIDQMFVWVDAQGRRFQPSNIAAGTEYTALEEQEAEMAPDKIQCAVAAHQKLYVFGRETLQSYTSTGDPEELFADDKAGINVGCASPHAVALIDNTLVWVDNKGILRRLNGGIAQRISTHAIEKAWSRCDLSKCFVYVWEDVGHAVVYVTFPDGMTWGYDCATQRLHRRQSAGMNRCRLNGIVQWDGVWYGGDFNSGTVYALDWDYPLEGCEELKVRVVVPGLHNGGNRVQVDGVRVQFDTGYPSVACQDVDPIEPDVPGYFAAGLISSPPPSKVVFGYIAPSITDDFVLVDENLPSLVESSAGVAFVGGWMVLGPEGAYAYRSQYPFTTWTGVDTGSGNFNRMCSHGTKVICRSGLPELAVSTDYGATWAEVNAPTTTVAGGGTYYDTRASFRSLDGKLVIGTTHDGDAILMYSTTVADTASFTTVIVAEGIATNVGMIDFTGTHWVAVLGTGAIYRATDIDGPYTEVYGPGDLFDAAYYPNAMACSDSGLLLAAYYHADTTEKLLVSDDHGATWTDQSATFPGVAGVLVCIDNVFYQGWDKTTDGITWTLKSLSGDDEFARFDGLVAYQT